MSMSRRDRELRLIKELNLPRRDPLGRGWYMFTMGILVGILLAGGFIIVMMRPIHHCHEDEAQVVTPEGLACQATDGGELRLITDNYKIIPE